MIESKVIESDMFDSIGEFLGVACSGYGWALEGGALVCPHCLAKVPKSNWQAWIRRSKIPGCVCSPSRRVTDDDINNLKKR